MAVEAITFADALPFGSVVADDGGLTVPAVVLKVTVRPSTVSGLRLAV